MKKIGLVGGIGPASTVQYYLGLIEVGRRTLGVYPEIVIDSVDMAAHDRALAARDDDGLCRSLLASLSGLKAAGAEIAAITANAEHIVWDQIRGRSPLPLISIMDAAAGEILRAGFRRVLVFGTAVTLRSRLYEAALAPHGVTAIIPSGADIDRIDRLIYPNLENGIVCPADRKQLIDLAEAYIAKEQADALLLACTELPLAIKAEDISVPVLDSAALHIQEIFRTAARP